MAPLECQGCNVFPCACYSPATRAAHVAERVADALERIADAMTLPATPIQPKKKEG